jgi:nucleotide-binding universal stress UspA family protein
VPTLISPGETIDGYTVGPRLHAGGTAYIFHVRADAAHDPGYPLVMKEPGVGRGEPTIGVVSFEIEETILPRLASKHVPRVAAVGRDPLRPYIVMEEIAGEGLAKAIERAPLPAEDVARIGAALADALHDVHRQNVVHHDIKAENFILRPDGRAVLLDFGFARHAELPDLIAEDRSFLGAGSAAYVSPEQLAGMRGDPRSDVFGLGVLLYQLATGTTPFGEPETFQGLEDRRWRVPAPPRAVVESVPPWLQEVILHCLEPDPAQRIPSAAHVAFDLRHPGEVKLTARAGRTDPAGLGEQIRNWWQAKGARTVPVAPRTALSRVPVVVVAIDTERIDDPRHEALRRATGKILAANDDYRLLLVASIGAAPIGEGDALEETASGRQLAHRHLLRAWFAPLKLPAEKTSLHVVESPDAAATILDIARTNNADMIVMGAPSPRQRTLAWWRSTASSVAAEAPCSVYLVRIPGTPASPAPPSDSP